MTLLPHRHAPTALTIKQETYATTEQARIVRSIIKELTKNELLDPARFPKTAALPLNTSDRDIVLSAIAETMNGEVKSLIIPNSKGSVELLHVSVNNKDVRSIGFNTDYNHFYLRSEDELNDKIEHAPESVHAL